MYTQIDIDVKNPPKKMRLHLGGAQEVTCRAHFLRRFSASTLAAEAAWGHTIITRIEKADDDEPCFDCTHNP